MTAQKSSFWKNYSNIILLLIGISVGSVIGVVAPGYVEYLKPIGDLFLNLLFVTVIPLVFFAIVSSVASVKQKGELGRILFMMVLTFLAFIVISALFTVAAVYLFPTDTPEVSLASGLEVQAHGEQSWGEQLTSFFTVGEFYQLFSRQHMLPLLVFSFLLGISLRKIPEAKIKTFKNFIEGGNEAMKGLLLLIMRAAPVGLGAYIAYQVGTVGPQLFGFYAQPLGIYYIGGTVYFFVFFSLYAYFSRGFLGARLFWKHNILPTFTALSTCSSLATMPVGLEAARRMGVPESIADVVISIGTNIHKNGSSISSIIKIYVVFLIMGWDFFTLQNILIAVALTVFVSMVEGGVPSGGYIGEMLMISAYNLPQEAIPAVMIIGTLVDPLATVLNACGNIVASLVVTRLIGEKWQVAQ